jgi:hypothetical protein
VARSHQKDVYGLLLREAAASVMALAADPKWVGGRPGILAVLHTWTLAMLHHPHGHLLVTAGGWDEDQQCWVKPAHERFLLSGRALSTIFRAKVKCAVYEHGLYQEVPASAWNKPWVVQCQPAGNGERVLDYLGRYVYRIAITNRRLVSFVDGQVTFTYRDRKTHQIEPCTVTAEEFIRRFLQHVLPRGFTKVRYYGIFSSACSEQLDHARTILTAAANNTGAAFPSLAASATESELEDGEIAESGVGRRTFGDGERCPVCGVEGLRLVPIPRKKWKPP